MQTITKTFTLHIAPVPTEVILTFPSFRKFGFGIYRFNNPDTVDVIEVNKGLSDIDMTINQMPLENFTCGVYIKGTPATAADWNQAILAFKAKACDYCNTNLETSKTHG